MPNMSYCMFENTASALCQILGRLSEVDSLNELKGEANQYEKPYIEQVHELVKQIAEEMDNLASYDEVE